MSRDPRDLVAELRAEAIKDGDPETCLGWEAADTIDALLARLTAAEAEKERYETIARAYRAEHSLYCTCEPCIDRDEILHTLARQLADDDGA
jgi:RPA family protein